MQKRIKSIVLWLGIISAAFLAVGIDWKDLTTWGMAWSTFIDFVQNPARMILFGITIYGVLNNPTRKDRF